MNKDALPRWIDIGLLPLINLAAALVVSGIIIAIISSSSSPSPPSSSSASASSPFHGHLQCRRYHPMLSQHRHRHCYHHRHHFIGTCTATLSSLSQHRCYHCSMVVIVIIIVVDTCTASLSSSGFPKRQTLGHPLQLPPLAKTVARHALHCSP